MVAHSFDLHCLMSDTEFKTHFNEITVMSFAHFSLGSLLFFLLICKKVFIQENSP